MKLEKNTLYFDASHSLFELEDLLNINFSDYLTRENIGSIPINTAIKCVFEGFDILASNLDKNFNAEPTLYEQYSFIDLMSSVNKRYDYLLIDISSSLKKNNYLLASAADLIVFIIDEFQSVYLRAFNEMLTLNKHYGCNNFGVIINRAISKKHGYEIFNRFAEFIYESEECLKTIYIDSIIKDVNVMNCTLNKEFVQEKFPGCDYSISINDIANKIELISKINAAPRGSVELFPDYHHQII